MRDESIARLVWRQWCREFARWERTWTRERRVATPMPPVPAICRTFMCGAQTRQGIPCQRRDVHHGPSGRCRLHGGRSTGPKTAEGKHRAALNGLRPKRKRTP
jgi:hypothetical protein